MIEETNMMNEEAGFVEEIFSEAEEQAFLEGFNEAESGVQSSSNESDYFETDTGDEKKPEQDFLTIRYNGSEVKLKKDEAIIAAQKGLNYEKLEGKLEANRLAQQDLEMLDSYAQANGVTRAEVLQNLIAGNMPAQALTPANHRQVMEDKKDFMELISEYPNITALPQEVIAMLKQGTKPVDAYRTYENNKLKNALAMQEKKQQNLQNHVGSASGEAEASAEDPFLVGFNSV